MIYNLKIAQVALRWLGLAVVLAVGLASVIGSSDEGTPTTSSFDPNFVVFLADKTTDGTFELYSYSLDSETVTRLNGTLVAGGNVTSFSVSPDGAYVAYVADQETDERYELYVAQIDGASVTKLSQSGLNPLSGVEGHPVWAPDSSRIAYRSDESDRGDDVYVLRTVQPDGTGNVIVNPVGVTGSSIAATSFAWAPDSSRIAYLADQESLGTVELFTSLADSASGNVKVNGDLVTNGDVTEFAWAPDGTRIAYRADQNVDEHYELWTASPTPSGIANVRVSGSYTANEDVQTNSFSWAPDSSYIAYIADESTDEVFELYAVRPTGSNRLQVSYDFLLAGGDVIGTPSWSPDSKYIAYVGDLETDNQFELYVSIPTVTGSNKLNSTLLGGSVETGPSRGDPPAWSPDSNGIAYIAQQNSGVDEVYVGSPNGTNVRVSSAQTAGSQAYLGPAGEVWAPDGSRLMYKADSLVDGTLDLFTSLPGGNTSITRITRTPAQTDGLQSFGKWALDGSYIAYVSMQDAAGVSELYMATPVGADNQQVSGNLVSGGDVDSTAFEWALEQ